MMSPGPAPPCYFFPRQGGGRPAGLAALPSPRGGAGAGTRGSTLPPSFPLPFPPSPAGEPGAGAVPGGGRLPPRRPPLRPRRRGVPPCASPPLAPGLAPVSGASTCSLWSRVHVPIVPCPRVLPPAPVRVPRVCPEAARNHIFTTVPPKPWMCWSRSWQTPPHHGPIAIHPILTSSHWQHVPRWSFHVPLCSMSLVSKSPGTGPTPRGTPFPLGIKRNTHPLPTPNPSMAHPIVCPPPPPGPPHCSLST